MIERRLGLTKSRCPQSQLRPQHSIWTGTNIFLPYTDSYAEFFGGVYRAVRSIPGMGGRVYRRMLVLSDGINQKIDETAFLKWKADPEYRPPNLGQAGRADVTFNVARDDLGNPMSSASFPVTERRESVMKLLEVVTGLLLVYLIFAIVVSGIQEWWAQYRGHRGKFLRIGLQRLIGDESIFVRVLQHPLIGSLYRDRAARGRTTLLHRAQQFRIGIRPCGYAPTSSVGLR
jgi:hypothetical protein